MCYKQRDYLLDFVMLLVGIFNKQKAVIVITFWCGTIILVTTSKMLCISFVYEILKSWHNLIEAPFTNRYFPKQLLNENMNM